MPNPRISSFPLAFAAIALLTSSATAQWGIVGRNFLELDDSLTGPVAELSGVTYLGPQGTGLERFAAVQDNGDGLVLLDVAVNADASLISAVGVGIVAIEDRFDAEGVAFAGLQRNSVFVSHERDPDAQEVLPGLREYDLLDGSLLQTVSLSDPWHTDGVTRSNRGFESLARAPAGGDVWVANEEALTIDGPLATQSAGTTVRLQKLTASGDDLTAAEQFAYEVEPIHGPTNSSARSGLSDLVALPDGSLLTLERSAALTFPGFLNRIYQVDTTGATDVSVAPFVEGLIGEPYAPVDKTLLFSGGVGGFLGSNLEGLALGPRLASGNWLLLGVVDNGGGATGNLIVSFELSPPPNSLVGDFNFDGIVDAIDYAVWRGGLSVFYDSQDFLAWDGNYGASQVISMEVMHLPTPRGVLLMLLALVGTCLPRLARTRPF